MYNTTRRAFRGAADSTHRVHIRSHTRVFAVKCLRSHSQSCRPCVWDVGGYSCGVARCQTCHDFVLVVCLLEPIVQVHFASFQMQLGEDPVAAGSPRNAFPADVQRQQNTPNCLEFALFAEDPQDVSVIPCSTGDQYSPAHGRIKNTNLVQVDTTGPLAKDTPTRCRFQSRGYITDRQWNSSLQTVDHDSNDRIR